MFLTQEICIWIKHLQEGSWLTTNDWQLLAPSWDFFVGCFFRFLQLRHWSFASAHCQSIATIRGKDVTWTPWVVRGLDWLDPETDKTFCTWKKRAPLARHGICFFEFLVNARQLRQMELSEAGFSRVQNGEHWLSYSEGVPGSLLKNGTEVAWLVWKR